MSASTTQLDISYLAIYALLSIPIIYTLVRHGKHGIPGWGYLLAFCLLRMTGAGLQLNDPTGQTAQIIGGVGLSPLLLAILGVLHESNHYISTRPKPFLLGTIFYIIVHLIVGGAVGLLVAGSTATPPEQGVARAGYFVFLLIWLGFVGLCALSWRHPKSRRDAKLLLFAVLASLPFLGVRIMYSLIASFDQSISPYTGPIAYRVVLDALMEFFMVIELVAVGVLTRNIVRDVRASREEGLLLQPRRDYAPVVPGVK